MNNFLINYRYVIIGLTFLWLAMVIIKRFTPKFIKHQKLELDCVTEIGLRKKIHWSDRILYLLIPWKKTCTLRSSSLPKIKVESPGYGYKDDVFHIINTHPSFYILLGSDKHPLVSPSQFEAKYSRRRIDGVGITAINIRPPYSYYGKGTCTLVIFDGYNIWTLVKR